MSKSRLGFTWTDEHSMGVTPEMQQQWDELCRVCMHLTHSLITATCYQGKSNLSKYANKGWPHFTVMQELVTLITKGLHAHQGIQPTTNISTENTSSSSCIPPPPKRTFDHLNNSGASSSTSLSKRPRNAIATQTVAFGLKTSIDNFADIIHELTDKLCVHTPSLPLPPPHVQAIKHLYESIHSSEGGSWLSDSDFHQAMQLFEGSDRKCKTFNTLAGFKDGRKHLCLWLQAELGLVSISASAGALMDEAA